MHKARVARRNYHKDRAGIEDTRAREGTEILYTWINLRYISLKRRPGPVTRLPLPELDFAYFRRCESGPCLYPHLSCPSLSLSLLIIAVWISTSYALYACLLGTFYVLPLRRRTGHCKTIYKGISERFATFLNTDPADRELFQNNFALNFHVRREIFKETIDFIDIGIVSGTNVIISGSSLPSRTPGSYFS